MTAKYYLSISIFKNSLPLATRIILAENLKWTITLFIYMYIYCHKMHVINLSPLNRIKQYHTCFITNTISITFKTKIEHKSDASRVSYFLKMMLHVSCACAVVYFRFDRYFIILVVWIRFLSSFLFRFVNMNFVKWCFVVTLRSMTNDKCIHKRNTDYYFYWHCIGDTQHCF